MRNDHTELVFILDRSGSMHGLEANTIGGFNRVLDEHRALPGTENVTTILFDDEITLLHDRLPIGAIRPITAADYRVGGCTALLDAVGYGIDKLVRVQDALGDTHRAGKVQFVIMTDGQENASSKFTLADIRRSIAQRQEKDGWDFLFLGAGIDAVETARSMAIPAERAVTAVHDSMGTTVQYEAVACATAEFRRSGARGRAWKQAVEADTASRG